MNDPYPLLDGKCRACGAAIKEDAKRVTRYYYAGTVGPLCSEACAVPYETMETRTKRGYVSNLRRIDQRRLIPKGPDRVATPLDAEAPSSRIDKWNRTNKGLACPHCPPNRGENRKRAPKRGARKPKYKAHRRETKEQQP